MKLLCEDGNLTKPRGGVHEGLACISAGRCFRKPSAGSLKPSECLSRLATRWRFNKYGMAKGHIEYVSLDAAELPDTRERDRKDTREHVRPPFGFRALVALDLPCLERDGNQYRVSAGMLVC